MTPPDKSYTTGHRGLIGSALMRRLSLPFPVSVKRCGVERFEITNCDLKGTRRPSVSTKVLNQAVRRNIQRFSADFMFQLDKVEKGQVVTNCDHLAKLKFSPTQPYAFEQKIGSHDQAIAGLIDAIRQLMATPAQSQRPIGFIATDAASGKTKK